MANGALTGPTFGAMVLSGLKAAEEALKVFDSRCKQNAPWGEWEKVVKTPPGICIRAAPQGILSFLCQKPTTKQSLRREGALIVRFVDVMKQKYKKRRDVTKETHVTTADDIRHNTSPGIDLNKRGLAANCFRSEQEQDATGVTKHAQIPRKGVVLTKR